MPPSGSITSPCPLSRNVCSLSADQQQGFQMAQKLVGAPVFGQFDGAAAQVAVILLQLGFEAAEEGEGVGGRAGESGQNLVLVEPADLLGRVLDDDSPRVTWPSPAMTTLPLRRTDKTVVERISRFFVMSAILDYNSAGEGYPQQ